MKYFGKKVLIVALIFLAGCAYSSSKKFSLKYDFMTLAKDSTRGNDAQIDKDFSEFGKLGIDASINQSAREPDNDALLMVLAKAEYDQGEYRKALAHIDKAINIRNYGMMGMRIAIEGVAISSMNIAQAIVCSAEDLMKPKYHTKACRITEIEKDGPADKAGLKVGDRLISIDAIKLLNYKAAKNEIEKYIQGKQPSVSVEIRKYGAPSRVSLVLDRFNDPRLAYKLALKSLLLIKIGNMDEALKCAQESLDNYMSGGYSESMAKQAMGKIYIMKGKYVDAVNLISGLTESLGVVIIKAEAYARQGDFDKAISLYEEKLAGNKLFLRNGHYQDDHNELLKVFAPGVKNILKNAKQLEKKDKFQEALDEYSRAMLFLDENEREKIRGDLFRITSDMSSAPEISNRAHKHALRAELLVKEGKFEASLVEFNEALLYAPYSAKLYLNSALVYGKLQKYGQAIERIRIYIKAAPQALNIQEAEDMIIKWELKSEQR